MEGPALLWGLRNREQGTRHEHDDDDDDDDEYFSKILLKTQVSLKSDKNSGNFHEDKHTFLITSSSVLPRMKNISDESYGEYRRKYFMFSNIFSKIVPFMR